MQQRSNRQRWWQKRSSDRPATVTSAESKIYFNSLENTKWQSTAPGPPLPLLPEVEEIEKRDVFNELKVKKPKVHNINTGTVRGYARENRLFSKWLYCGIYAEVMERVLRGFIVLLCVVSVAATVSEEPPRQVAKMWTLISSDVFMAFSHCCCTVLRYWGTQCRWCPHVLECIIRTVLPSDWSLIVIRLRKHRI